MLRVAARYGFAFEFLERPTLPLKPLLGVLAACAIAACVGPYTYHPYEVVFNYSQSQATYSLIQELQPPNYQSFTDYALLLLTVAGFFAVGRRSKLDLFRVCLLAVAAVCAFRTARDEWFVGICAAAFIADVLRREEATPATIKPGELVTLWAAVAVLLFLVGSNFGFSTRELDRSISRTYPVDAVNFLRRNPVPGPLYNSLDWGGFLIWYLPQYPVSIDGRNDLYGDAFDVAAFKSIEGDYANDPNLKEARLVLLPKSTPLATMLKVDPRFAVIYEDQIATVLVKK